MPYSLYLTLFSHLSCVVLDTALQFVFILKLATNEQGHLQTLPILFVQTLFFLPFIILGTLAGSLSDKFSKTHLLKIYRLCEIPLFYLAVIAISSESNIAFYTIILFKGIFSTLNSPVKIGLLPEFSVQNQLSKANGIYQLFIVAGTIIGTVGGGLIVENSVPQILIYFACLNFLFALLIKKSKAQNPAKEIQFNPLPNQSSLSEFKRVRPLFLANLAISFFWALATFYKVAIVLFAEKVLLVQDETSISYLLVAVGIGLALGSLLSAKISFGQIEIGLVPIGSFFIAVTSFLIVTTTNDYLPFLLLLLAQGFASGIFIVPLSSYFQSECNPKSIGSQLAIQNQISFTLIIMFTIFIPIIVEVMDIGIRPLFLIGGCLMLGITLFLLKYIPHMLIRFLNWMLVNTFYKVKIDGKENVPRGGALLISNHISFVDAALIQACLERQVRFLMFKPIYDNKFIHPIVSKLGVIPIEGGKKDSVEEALKQAQEFVKAGDLVCIFPEGAISRIGVLQPFKRGMEKIMSTLGSEPIIPVYLDQLWGSIFSFKGGKFVWKLPREVPYPISITFGKALPSNTSAKEAYLKVEEIGAEVFTERKEFSQNLPYRAIKSLKRNLINKFFVDTTGLKLHPISFLGLSLWLAKNLKNQGDSSYVALHLPNSVVGAATNLSLITAGKIPVNLNGTSGQDAINSALEQLQSEILITSKKYLDKLPLKVPNKIKVIFLEDLLSTFSLTSKIINFFQAFFLPTSFLIRLINPHPIDSNATATVIFSSGSTGAPKGVELTHKNILSNVSAVSQLFELDDKDTILGCLPFFHSFGFTFTLWFPLLEQLNVCYHPNPLDAGQIGLLAKKYKASILFATPTFLQLYLKKCTPEQFISLKEVMVGAEKLSRSLAQAFEKKFGIEPKEGYGCTELSPLALVNSYNFGSGREQQKGKKGGTVGLPIPGVTVKVVNPDTYEPVDNGGSGLLLVKGANVMKGYFKNPELTSEVIKENWYITGDIASRDEEGFVTIEDRISRFSKIAGEMVPHIKIEELIQEIIGKEERSCVVTGLPDAQKGEKLKVLILKGINLDVEALIRKLKDKGLPNLWIPKAESFKEVDAFPLLATGKLDLKSIQQLAAEED